MTVYFNEHDAFPAAWLRELWPDATVDERSIVDVQASDVSGFDRAHFFGGIGGWQYALELAGFPADRPVWTGSCPCQPFSVAGRGAGTDDARHLWPELRRLIEVCRPDTIFGEQVASRAGREWLAGIQIDLEALGYAFGAADLCAAGVGAPHIRQRLYWVAVAEHAERRPVGVDRQDVGDGSHGGRAEAHGQLGARCEVCGMEITGRERPRRSDSGSGEGACADGSGSSGESGGSGGSGGLGFANSTGPQQGRQTTATARHGCSTVTDGGVVWLVHTTSGRFGVDGRAPRNPRHADEPSAVVGVGNPDDPRSQRRSVDTRQHTNERAPWSSMSTVPCADGKARRTQPGIFPLVDGLPKGVVRSRDPGEPFDANATAEARVGRLRGYGNAIVPQLAATFIRAFLDVEDSL